MVLRERGPASPAMRPGGRPQEADRRLRSSRETELAAEYTLHLVCAWIGSTEWIAQKHYPQVTDADFERAAKGGAAARHTGTHSKATGWEDKATPFACKLASGSCNFTHGRVRFPLRNE
jgi:hypothetical protein